MVKDQFDTGSHKQVHTQKVSCQFPILEIWDLSSTNADNLFANGWEVTNDFPTLQQVEDLGLKKEYNASVWARDGEELTFHVKFGAGSHIGVNWTIEEVSPNGGSPGDTVVDDCETKDGGGFPSKPNGWPGSFWNTFTAAQKCVFPFRYDNVLYYGCTQLTIGSLYSMCATDIDSDYNALKMGHCNGFCHYQLPRPEELGGTLATSTYTYTHGGFTYEKTYILPLETELVLKRTFDKPGQIFRVVMNSKNMHNEEDRAVMEWKVTCANPIVPADWDVEFEPYIYEGDKFELILKIKSGVKLPTWPTVEVVQVTGEQRLDDDWTVVNSTKYWYSVGPGNCSACPLVCPVECVQSHQFADVGYDCGATCKSSGSGNLVNNNNIGDSINISVSLMSEIGTHGFAVLLFNAISSVKFEPGSGPGDWAALTPAHEDVQVLDPLPDGMGEWVTLYAPKWDYLWVETYRPIDTPVDFKFWFRLHEYGNELQDLPFENGKFYMAAAGHPYFNVSFYGGSVRRIQYTMNNTDIDGYNPPPCAVDWPDSAYKDRYNWIIHHCPNVSEGTYDVLVSVWNPLDGFRHSAPTQIKVMERIGPIWIDDFQQVTDSNETKPFVITLERGGILTCVVVDYGDGSQDFFGNLESCQFRYPSLLSQDVHQVDDIKEFACNHTYIRRGNYKVHVYGYDERQYAENFLDILVFQLDCSMPFVWIPNNQTSYLKWEAIPRNWKSKPFQTQAISNVECSKPTPTYKTWRLYIVDLINDPGSHTGLSEELIEIPINGTLSSWNSSMLDVPSNFLDYGLHKIVFKFEVETYTDDVVMFKEAYTYINITKSDLVAVLVAGSATSVARGWGQLVYLPAELNSFDPDEPDTQEGLTYQWFCRVVTEGREENYTTWDSDGFPLWRDVPYAQQIPPPSDPVLINTPPGCFGRGAGPLKKKAGTLRFNSSSFIAYANVFEVSETGHAFISAGHALYISWSQIVSAGHTLYQLVTHFLSGLTGATGPHQGHPQELGQDQHRAAVCGRAHRGHRVRLHVLPRPQRGLRQPHLEAGAEGRLHRQVRRRQGELRVALRRRQEDGDLLPGPNDEVHVVNGRRVRVMTRDS